MKDGAHVTAKDASKLFPISATSLRSKPGPTQERSELMVPQVENDSTTDKTASTSYQVQEAPPSPLKSKITMAGRVIEVKLVETADSSKEEMEAREHRKQETMEKHERWLEKRKKRNENLNTESHVVQL